MKQNAIYNVQEECQIECKIEYQKIVQIKCNMADKMRYKGMMPDKLPGLLSCLHLNGYTILHSQFFSLERPKYELHVANFGAIGAKHFSSYG